MDSDLTPPIRIRRLGSGEIAPEGRYVLLWMTAQRRTRYNFALQRAVALANELRRPLLVFEPLRVGYRWASERMHTFVIQGMADNARDCEGVATYFPYVEPAPDRGKGLLQALATESCAVITDAYPCFFLRDLADKAASRIPVHFEVVDSCGLVPMVATDRVFTTAHSFRRYLQTALCVHLADLPHAEPLEALAHRDPITLAPALADRWPAADVEGLLAGGVGRLPIDRLSAATFSGGAAAARERLRWFVSDGLPHYAQRNHPDVDAASGLSPYLHFGHISPVEIFTAVATAYDWSPDELVPAKHGSRTGWWGLPPAPEGFFDELITWREIGFNMCVHRSDYDQLSSLPDWAQRTMTEHADDPRPELYGLDDLTNARTEDAIWNAAQRQLVTEGRMHNYLRMLWGKKIYQWSPDPATALAWMIELNNRYAVDGRDPNSYSGIFWVLGRYDRAWGPERPIFGKLRYMTSDSTKRKLKMRGYLERYSQAGTAQGGLFG